MKRSIRDHRQEKPGDTLPPVQPEFSEMLGQVSPDTLNSVQDAVSQYSGKSESELMQELRQYRAAGAFDDRALQDMAARLAPMLTPEQQQRLFSVMKQI